jgi:uncharacterized protein involved in tolerance to divalent cations
LRLPAGRQGKRNVENLPCIMKIEVEANKEYFDWIKKETK